MCPLFKDTLRLSKWLLQGAEVPSLPFDELFLQTATKVVLKRPELLPVLNSPQGIFINGFSYGHSPCGPSSHWIEQLHCDFLREGCEFMAPKSKRGEEKSQREQFFSLITEGL